jgi:hypothetical protein
MSINNTPTVLLLVPSVSLIGRNVGANRVEEIVSGLMLWVVLVVFAEVLTKDVFVSLSEDLSGNWLILGVRKLVLVTVKVFVGDLMQHPLY